MKKSLFFTFIFSLFLIPCLAQENITCPKIKISASKDKYDPGEPVPFSVSLPENPGNLKLEYEWQISAGTISDGRGTPSITIDTAGLDDTTVTATIKIKGLPGGCKNEFYSDVVITAKPHCILPDEFQGPQRNTEIKIRLKYLYSALLLNDPTATAVITNSGTDKQVALRKAKLMKAIKSLKYDITRFKFVRGSSEPGIRTSFWIIPKTEAENFKP